MEKGGAQKLIFDILTTKKSSVNIAIFTLKNTNSFYIDQLKKNKIQIFKSNTNRYWSIKNLVQIKKISKNFDVIHCHLFQAQYNFAIAKFIFRLDIPSVVTEHSTHNRRRKKIFRPIDRFSYSQFDCIVAVSKGVKKNLKDWLGEDNRVSIVQNGIKLSSKNTHTSHKDIRFENGTVSLLMVARFTDSKNHIMLLDALKILPSNFKLVLAGDGENLKNIKKYTHLLGLENRVQFLGHINDLSKVYKKADIYVQASNWEGFSLSTLEAMSYGLPVLGTNVTGLRELLYNSGLIIENNNHVELRNEILKLYHDRTKMLNLSKLSITTSYNYDIKKTINSYMNIYQDILY